MKLQALAAEAYVLASVVHFPGGHARCLGVVPEIAARAHIEMTSRFCQALAKASRAAGDYRRGRRGQLPRPYAGPHYRG